MSALKTTAGEPALAAQPITHDQARALLGQVMGFVAVTVGFTALGAYLGRDLSGGTGLVLFVYVAFHLVNVSLGLYSIGLMEAARPWFQGFWTSIPGMPLPTCAPEQELDIGYM